VIDLRTDALSTPTEAMWEAMRRAEVGWAVRDEDPAVNELQRLAAELTGKEAALLVPACSTANLLALMTLGQHGTQVILEAGSHIVTTEEFGMVSVAGLFPRLLRGDAGVLDPDAVEAAIAEAIALGMPPTSLVCLENSHNNAGGVAITPAQTEAVAVVARRHAAMLHLDGARLFNSAHALGVPARRLAEPVDTVSISLNKGLCAPLGALLCGRRDMIERARSNARRIGAGSLHKAGLFAAAGVVALTQMVERLADDNRRAAGLARRLALLPGLRVDLARVQTNIVMTEVVAGGLSADALVRRLAERGVLALARPGERVRFVTHRLIGDAEIDRTALAVEGVGASCVRPQS